MGLRTSIYQECQTGTSTQHWCDVSNRSLDSCLARWHPGVPSWQCTVYRISSQTVQLLGLLN